MTEEHNSTETNTGFWKGLWAMLEAMSASDPSGEAYLFERLRSQDERILRLEETIQQNQTSLNT